MQVRVLILSPFKYVYKNKQHSYFTGESFYLDTDLLEEKQEVEYLLNSEISELVYVENKPQVISKLKEKIKTETETVTESDEVPVEDEREIFQKWNQRKEELEKLHWQQLKKEANNLGIDYTFSEETINKILISEFDGDPLQLTMDNK